MPGQNADLGKVVTSLTALPYIVKRMTPLDSS